MFSIKITRRQFLKWLSASAAALGLSETELLKMKEALATPYTACDPDFPRKQLVGMPGTLARVIWIAGAACSGCPTSLLNYIADPADPVFELNAIANNAVPGYPMLDIGNFYPVTGGPDGDIDIGEAVLEIVTIDYSQIVAAAAGDVLNNYLGGLVMDPNYKYVLMIEGTIQTAANGRYCRILDIPGDWRGGIWDPYVIYDPVAVRTEFTMAGASLWLASNPNCLAVLALGTCASFGGVPAAKGSVTKGKSAWEWLNQTKGLNKTIVNIPGCPPHPDWFIQTVAAFLLGTLQLDTSLDHKGRPRLTSKAIFDEQGRVFCKCCPRDESRPGPIMLCETIESAANPNGKCLQNNGCSGWKAGPAFIRADCCERQWNNHTNWCVGNNYPCQGCTDPGFPDVNSPFFEYHT